MTFNFGEPRRSRKTKSNEEATIYVHGDGKGSFADLYEMVMGLCDHPEDIDFIGGGFTLTWDEPASPEDIARWEESDTAARERHEQWVGRMMAQLIDKYGSDTSQWPVDWQGWREAKDNGAFW